MKSGFKPSGSIGVLAAVVTLLQWTACSSLDPNRIIDAPGRATVVEDPSSASRLRGTGLESQDIASACSKMVQSMSQNPLLMNRNSPRVIIDETEFRNDTNMTINPKLMTERMLVSMTKAANGRMRFVGRKHIRRVMEERGLMDAGVVDGGSLTRTQKMMGSDYQLFVDLVSQSARTGAALRSDYYYISAKMLDLSTSEIVWADDFEVKKTGQDDIVYR